MDNHLKVMMDCLNVAQIRSWLKQYNVLTTEEHDHLLSKFDDSSSRAAKETLINMLRTKGAKGLYHFMEALKDTAEGTGHHDILCELQEDPDVERIVTSYRSSNL